MSSEGDAVVSAHVVALPAHLLNHAWKRFRTRQKHATKRVEDLSVTLSRPGSNKTTAHSIMIMLLPLDRLNRKL